MWHLFAAAVFFLCPGESFGQEHRVTSMTLFSAETGREIKGSPGGEVDWELDASLDPPTYRIVGGRIRIPGSRCDSEGEDIDCAVDLSAAAARRFLRLCGYFRSYPEVPERPGHAEANPPPELWNPAAVSVTESDFFLVRFAELARRTASAGARVFFVFEDSDGEFAVVLRTSGSRSSEVLGSQPPLWGGVMYTECEHDEVVYEQFPVSLLGVPDAVRSVLTIGYEGAVFDRHDGDLEARLLKEADGAPTVRIWVIPPERVLVPQYWSRHLVGLGADPAAIVSQMALELPMWWRNNHVFDPEVFAEIWSLSDVD